MPVSEQMWIRGENGALHLMDVPLPLGIQHRLDRGDLTRVNEDGTPWAEPGAEALEPPRGDLPPDAAPLPKRADNRATWTEFAVSQGMGREQAASMTKAELIELFTPQTVEDEQ
jgi:hypothetical protein